VTSTTTNAQCACSPGGFSTGTLTATNFGFSIPTNATITGVALTYWRYHTVSSGGGSGTLTLQGVTGGTTKSDSFPLSSGADSTIGADGDVWSATITPTQVNSSSFGVSLSVSGFNNTGSTQNAFARNFRLTVYYTIGGSKASCSSLMFF
jgi:hypothetical protein